jgi:hypothetical protein
MMLDDDGGQMLLYVDGCHIPLMQCRCDASVVEDK